MKPNIKILICMFLLGVAVIHGQQKPLIPSTNVDDTMRELETAELTLRFLNALNGKPIAGGQVDISDIGIFKTDEEGKVNFTSPGEDLNLEVIFQREGFITSAFSVEILAGTLFLNRFSISPLLPLGALRVVLDWDDQPQDLDAHFVKKDGYHISFRKLKVAADGAAQLDRDDLDGNGPETLTANRIDNQGTYYYFVHDYTNRAASNNRELSRSKACVKIYGDNRLLHVLRVPLNKTGTYWPVFRIVKGQIVIPDQDVVNHVMESF